MVLQALPMKLDCVASVGGRPEYAWKTEVSDLSHVSAMTSNVSGSAVADTAASNTLRSASACAPHALMPLSSKGPMNVRPKDMSQP